MHLKSSLFSLYKYLVNNFLTRLPLWRFSSAGIVHNFFIHLLKPPQTIIWGQNFFLDPPDCLRLSINPQPRPFEIALIRQLIKPGHTVLDLGAHIGYYTVLFSDLVGTTGKVYAFEPSPDNLRLLTLNTQNRSNVTIIPMAVTEHGRPLELFISTTSQADHYVYDLHEGRKSIQVNSVVLDDYFDNQKFSINFVKLDIQGSEFAAVKSMTRLLRTNPHAKLFTEFDPSSLTKFGISPTSFLQHLVDSGFKIYDVDEPRQHLFLTDPGRLLTKYPPLPGFMTNLLCTKKSLEFNYSTRPPTR